MTELVANAIALASQVLQLINNAQAMKYVDQLKQSQMDLLAESGKGYDSDDAKVEALQGQIAILLGSINNELQVFSVSKPPGHAPVPAVAPGGYVSPKYLRF